ncbi:putative odorant receptor 92a [Zootermopsis nevadensis]|nr:putative odorant receptor 92a [Zootermopsis nevadensis]
MQKQLNDCIRHHQKILRYIQVLEDTMNFPLCGLFLIFLSAMCFDAFSAITSWGDHTDVSQALAVYIVQTGCMCVYCWLGNELSEGVESVRDAAWGCDWVGTPVPFQRCLMFIIAKANKEFILTAGKFVPVSNKTMMNMMNQSISFFMFLLHMKDKNADNNQGV